jgi:hypothetical protein
LGSFGYLVKLRWEGGRWEVVLLFVVGYHIGWDDV